MAVISRTQNGRHVARGINARDRQFEPLATAYDHGIHRLAIHAVVHHAVKTGGAGAINELTPYHDSQTFFFVLRQDG